VRLLFCWMCGLGWATYPDTYTWPIKQGLDVVVDVLLEVPLQPVSCGTGLRRGERGQEGCVLVQQQ
jgi:hypothetical protein